MANKGWIYLHRSIEDCALWQLDEPFDRRSAWVDLLLMTNHESREILVNNCPLVVHRGQKFTSFRKLAERWRWSRSKLERYIRMLKSAGMIEVCGTHNGTLITIINYSVYQDQRDMKRDTVEATGGTRARTRSSTKQQMKTIKQINNETNKDGGSADMPETNPDGVPFQ